MVRRIVVPVGGSDREFLAQEQAIEMAAELSVPATAVHVRADPDAAPEDLFRFLRQLAQRWDVALTETVLAGTEPASVLVDELDALDLLVIGTGRLGTRYHVGSVAEKVLKQAPCPLLVVRLDGAGPGGPRTPDEGAFRPS